ncbi:MAG TPA: hypothetical protein VFB80_01215, partial [Pirellulaceae bacterium]|nr:hypothetical protein [Pirellulaceae bacterium]
MQRLLMLAEASATIQYKLARLQTLTEWWHWMVLLTLALAIGAFVVWMYRRDSVELPRSLAITLCLLRLVAFVGILFFFFGLEKRAERNLVKNSRAILLIDTSQSMGLRDSDSSNVPAAMMRVEHVAAELAGGAFIEKLREKHDVIAYRFDQGDNPIEIATYPRKATKAETAEAQISEEDRLRQIASQSRWLAYVAAGILVASIVAGLVYLIGGRKWSTRSASGQTARGARGLQKEEPTSWALLVCMTLLIAAAVVMATASLRGSEAGLLAILGIEEPKPSAAAAAPEKKAEQVVPQVDWTEQLKPRGALTRIGDNLKYLIDKERGGPIAAVLLFTDGGNNAGSDVKLAATAAGDATIPIYTVGLGSDKRPANVRVVDLEAPERVYPGDKFTLTGY